jgi:hypothetical protein
MDTTDFTFACDIITQVYCNPCPPTVIAFQFTRVNCRSEISTKTLSATLLFHNHSILFQLIASSSCYWEAGIEMRPLRGPHKWGERRQDRPLRVGL